MIIRKATVADFETITGWLAAARLPVADLAIDDMAHFLLAESDGTPVGTVGLEPFDGIALLRSLVVVPRSQGGGADQKLVAALEAEADERGLNDRILETVSGRRGGNEQAAVGPGADRRSPVPVPEHLFAGLCSREHTSDDE